MSATTTTTEMRMPVLISPPREIDRDLQSRRGVRPCGDRAAEALDDRLCDRKPLPRALYLADIGRTVEAVEDLFFVALGDAYAGVRDDERAAASRGVFELDVDAVSGAGIFDRIVQKYADELFDLVAVEQKLRAVDARAQRLLNLIVKMITHRARIFNRQRRFFVILF